MQIINDYSCNHIIIICQFDIYRNKQISVTREVFDANGDLVTSGDGVKYEWTVTIPIARNDV